MRAISVSFGEDSLFGQDACNDLSVRVLFVTTTCTVTLYYLSVCLSFDAEYLIWLSDLISVLEALAGPLQRCPCPATCKTLLR